MTPDSISGTERGHERSTDRSPRSAALEAGKNALTAGRRGLWRALARPTVSDVAMIACTFAVGIGIGSRLVGFELAALAMGAGLGVALTTILLGSSRPLVRGFGGALAVPASVLLSSPVLVAAILAVTSPTVGVVSALTVWSLVIAAFAAGVAPWDRLGTGGVRRGATGTTLAAIGVVGVVVLRVVPESAVRDRAGAAVVDVLGAAGDFVAANDAWAVVSFAGLVVVTAVVSSRALRYVPFDRLVPPDRRGSFATGSTRLRWVCSRVGRGALVLSIVAVGASSVSARFETRPVTPAELQTGLPDPVGSGLATVVTSSGLRFVFGIVLVVMLSLSVLEWGRRLLGRNIARVCARLLAPVVGGAVVALVAARALPGSALEADLTGALEGTAPPSVLELLEALPAFAVAAVVLVVTLALLASMLWAVTMMRAFRLLPPRAIGAALAAGAMGVLAAGIAIVGQVEAAIITAAAAFVLWDIGEYADGVRTELGSAAATLRAELVHIGGTAATGAVVAVATVACYRWLLPELSISVPAHAAVAVGTGLLAVAFVVWVLRG
ncbi:DUF7519 family protein [Natronorubrum sulfidifaciens]|uniref:Uncharacterized protein n=1 Tax=Natronorubrum sulfidifaciens JCM 14089 TaxID=1230460 RepID=L9WA12_9EURY|nr:hypothetical protein [Natronorubrum sulfidifaciens]ELY45148.1 hypothetical protein C495_09405 [Natronorubrum sulfidifaciens JCM 14089]